MMAHAAATQVSVWAEVGVGQLPGVIGLSSLALAAAKVGERKQRLAMLPRLLLSTDSSHRRPHRQVPLDGDIGFLLVGLLGSGRDAGQIGERSPANGRTPGTGTFRAGTTAVKAGMCGRWDGLGRAGNPAQSDHKSPPASHLPEQS